MKSLGQMIKQRRLDKDLTQRKVAEAISISTSHLSKIEADRETPSDWVLEGIAKELGLDLDQLILAAGRLPVDVMDRLINDPPAALEFVRQVRESGRRS